MTQDELNRRLEELPAAVQDYLYSDEIGELNGLIIERNDLKDEDLPVLFALIKEAIVEAFPVFALVDEAKKRFKLDEARAKKLAADITGYRLLPFDKTLGDVPAAIRAFGGDPAAYPPFRLRLEERTSDQAAGDVVRALGTEAPAERLQQRLQNVVESFLSGIRTESQVRETLTRPEKVGGLGFDEASAERLIAGMKNEARSVIIRNEVPGAEAPAEPASPESKKDDFSTVRPEDEKEIRRLRQDVLPAKGAAASEETSKKIASSIEELYAASGLVTDDEAMARRVKSVIGSRLRDVRDAMETLETMIQPKELGGLGLGQDAARALLARIELFLKGVHAQHAETIQEEKKQWVAREETQRAGAETGGKKQEESELSRLYETIVRKAQPVVQDTAFRPNPPAPTPRGHAVTAMPEPMPKGAPPTNLPVGNLEPVPAPLRTPQKTPTAPPLPQPVVSPPKPPAPPPATVTLVRPTPPAAAPAAPSLPPARPKLEDVKPVAQLTGPVQELRLTTLADFRRLAKTPEEAAAKVKAKIALLADESYTKRNQGIAAWTESETHRTYLDMMREALGGQPLEAVIAGRRKAGTPFLAEEEFKAVAALSRQLRY